MKLIYKIIIGIVVIIAVAVIGGLLYVNLAFPKVSPAPKMTIKATPALLARGEYLVNHVTACMGCHSERDWNYYGGPPKEGTYGKGGELFDEGGGAPGKVWAKNITPAAIGSWTDGELYRAITAGVNKQGDPLFPIMPYMNFGNMDPEDLKAIIVYIRTLKPIPNDVPAHSLDFPMNLIVRTIPHDGQPTKRPPESDSVAYGKYLVSIASCADCHTQMVKGEFVKGMDFAGGQEFKTPVGTFRPANITPDNETGIGLWTEEAFIARFKAYEKPESQKIKTKIGEFNTLMPVTMYAGMTTGDLKSIYKYLRTVKPVHNKVNKYTAPSSNSAGM